MADVVSNYEFSSKHEVKYEKVIALLSLPEAKACASLSKSVESVELGKLVGIEFVDAL